MRILALFLGLLCLWSVAQSGPVPARPDGFTFGNGSAAAPIQVDAFFDLLCPDSKMAYPTLKTVAEHYGGESVRLRFHLFPLPYHHNAFIAAQSSFTITHFEGQRAFVRWMEHIFDEQDRFQNAITQNKGQKEVTEEFGTLAMKAFPLLTKAQWSEGMSGHGGTDMDVKARTAWKYACSRGIYGTPMFLVNDVLVDADGSWSAKDWYNLIDPLLEDDREEGADNQQQQQDITSTELKHRAITESEEETRDPSGWLLRNAHSILGLTAEQNNYGEYSSSSPDLYETWEKQLKAEQDALEPTFEYLGSIHSVEDQAQDLVANPQDFIAEGHSEDRAKREIFFEDLNGTHSGVTPKSFSKEILQNMTHGGQWDGGNTGKMDGKHLSDIEKQILGNVTHSGEHQAGVKENREGNAKEKREEGKAEKVAEERAREGAKHNEKEEKRREKEVEKHPGDTIVRHARVKIPGGFVEIDVVQYHNRSSDGNVLIEGEMKTETIHRGDTLDATLLEKEEFKDRKKGKKKSKVLVNTHMTGLVSTKFHKADEEGEVYGQGRYHMKEEGVKSTRADGSSFSTTTVKLNKEDFRTGRGRVRLTVEESVRGNKTVNEIVEWSEVHNNDGSVVEFRRAATFIKQNQTLVHGADVEETTRTDSEGRWGTEITRVNIDNGAVQVQSEHRGNSTVAQQPPEPLLEYFRDLSANRSNIHYNL